MSKKVKILLPILLSIVLVVAGLVYLHSVNIPVLEPHGTIGDKERQLIIIALLLSLIVIVPVFALLIVFAWKYREGNPNAAKTYQPKLATNRWAEIVWWAVPGTIILTLSIITWISSHQLDPYKDLSSSTAKPITIQVVALNWKWLFIYPEQHVATVNYVEIPQNTPINFLITSDTVMNSFWIPQLGGQIYAMPGMSTQLHLMASQVGDYKGSSANISGEGFAGMTFTAKAVTTSDFVQWAQTTQKGTQHLDQASYNALAQPSQNNPESSYGSVDPNLYDTIVMKYMMPMQTPKTDTKTAPSQPMNMDMSNMPGMSM